MYSAKYLLTTYGVCPNQSATSSASFSRPVKSCNHSHTTTHTCRPHHPEMIQPNQQQPHRCMRRLTPPPHLISCLGSAASAKLPPRRARTRAVYMRHHAVTHPHGQSAINDTSACVPLLLYVVYDCTLVASHGSRGEVEGGGRGAVQEAPEAPARGGGVPVLPARPPLAPLRRGRQRCLAVAVVGVVVGILLLAVLVDRGGELLRRVGDPGAARRPPHEAGHADATGGAEGDDRDGGDGARRRRS